MHEHLSQSCAEIKSSNEQYATNPQGSLEDLVIFVMISFLFIKTA